MRKVLFFNVDTQKDFVNKDGKLAVEGAEEIKNNLAILTKYAKDHDIPTINTADCHNSNSTELSNNPDFIKTFPSHCMRDSEGAKFIEETSPGDHALIVDWEDKKVNTEMIKMADDIILLKDAFDVFEGNNFTEDILNALNPSCILVYGVATNVCVDAAVTGLAKRGYNAVIVIDAIKELPNIPIKNIVKNWQKLGITFCSTNADKKILNNNTVKKIICRANCSCDFPTFKNIAMSSSIDAAATGYLNPKRT